MDSGILSLIISFSFLIFLMCFALYTSSLIYSSFKGSPYVPTNKKAMNEILVAAKLKKGSHMLELGCGDGRLIIEAVKRYGVRGLGIDINPLLIKRAKMNASRLGGTHPTFRTQNLRDINTKDFDVVYLFLLPELLAKYAPKWEREAKKNALYISHAFMIKRWDAFLEKRIHGNQYDTFYYRLNARSS